MLTYIVHKPMDIHGYSGIHWVWIWGDIHAHGYLRGWGKVMLMDMDLILVYSSKPGPLSSSGESTSNHMPQIVHSRRFGVRSRSRSFCFGFRSAVFLPTPSLHMGRPMTLVVFLLPNVILVLFFTLVGQTFDSLGLHRLDVTIVSIKFPILERVFAKLCQKKTCMQGP
jgi:hypothetical protein